MKYFNKYIYFILILFLIISCSSNKITSNYSMYEKIENYQEDENNQYDFENKIYKSSIHTVLLHPYGFELGEAILNLNKKDSLLLSFDELDSLPKNYFYTLIHCNADWTRSNLLETEYLKGFSQELIFEYTNSFNTIQNYVNYKATIPSKNMIPTYSGNYLLIVFEENKKDRPILSKQIMILNEKIKITNSNQDVLVFVDGKTTGITTVGINTTNETFKVQGDSNITITGIVTATEFYGSGVNLTGVSGFGTALDSTQGTLGNLMYKTPYSYSMTGVSSAYIVSDTTSGNTVFTRLGEIVVGSAATLHIGSGTTLAMDVLSLFLLFHLTMLDCQEPRLLT